MKHLRCIIHILGILLAALTGFLPAQETAQAAKDTSRLTEHGEQRANEIQPPDLVMDILGVRAGMVVGEVGAGRGRVSVHLAARVGEKGKVYANDINPRAIEYLTARCRRLGLANVETILSLPDDARFPRNGLDLAVMTYVYHHVDHPVPLLKSLLPSLKPWGIVALADPKHPEAGAKALTWESVGEEAGALRELFRDFEILSYREMDHSGDWGGPPAPHVQMLARKRGGDLALTGECNQAESFPGYHWEYRPGVFVRQAGENKFGPRVIIPEYKGDRLVIFNLKGRYAPWS